MVRPGASSTCEGGRSGGHHGSEGGERERERERVASGGHGDHGSNSLTADHGSVTGRQWIIQGRNKGRSEGVPPQKDRVTCHLGGSAHAVGGLRASQCFERIVGQAGMPGQADRLKTDEQSRFVGFLGDLESDHTNPFDCSVAVNRFVVSRCMNGLQLGPPMGSIYCHAACAWGGLWVASYQRGRPLPNSCPSLSLWSTRPRP